MIWVAHALIYVFATIRLDTSSTRHCLVTLASTNTRIDFVMHLLNSCFPATELTHNDFRVGTEASRQNVAMPNSWCPPYPPDPSPKPQIRQPLARAHMQGFWRLSRLRFPWPGPRLTRLGPTPRLDMCGGAYTQNTPGHSGTLRSVIGLGLVGRCNG
jgi:hypothetical protein